jgi:protein SCO1/2
MTAHFERCVAMASLFGASFIAAVALADGQSAVKIDVPAATDPHAHHHESSDSRVRHSEAQYSIPNVTLLREDGKTVALPAELDDGRPVLLNFVYTSCTTICPLSSQVFSQFQKGLINGREQVHLVSISIDPEQDTPARLRAYAEQYHAAPGWDHYTGAVAAINTVQRAFNAYREDKMSHTPLTLMREAPGRPWMRIDGFATVGDLMAEYKLWTAASASLVAQ